MNSKQPSASIIAERFNLHGHRLEEVEFTVNRVGDQVYVHIKGKGPAKDFVMDLGQWRQLEAAARDEET